MASRTFALRRPDRCAVCAAALAAGTRARWDADTRTVTCLACVDAETRSSAPALSRPDPGSAGVSAGREYERRRHNREQRTRTAHPHIGACSWPSRANRSISSLSGAANTERSRSPSGCGAGPPTASSCCTTAACPAVTVAAANRRSPSRVLRQDDRGEVPVVAAGVGGDACRITTEDVIEDVAAVGADDGRDRRGGDRAHRVGPRGPELLGVAALVELVPERVGCRGCLHVLEAQSSKLAVGPERCPQLSRRPVPDRDRDAEQLTFGELALRDDIDDR